MILHGKLARQIVDRGESQSFIKEIVVTEGAVPLAMIRKRAVALEGATKAPVLLVHGFGQNRYAWHLPSRSFANYLATRGYDVFNLDLRGHGRSRQLGGKRCRGVLDYVTEDMPSAVEEVQKQSGGRPLFFVGHSLGGLVGLAAAPALGDAIAGIATIGSPYHFTRGSLSLGCVSLLFRALAAAGVPLGNPRITLGSVAAMMNALRNVAEHPLYPIPWRGWHKGALEHAVLQEHLRLAFDEAGLAEMADMFEWAAQERFCGLERDLIPRFEALDLPLLVIAGIHDDLAPPEGVKPAYDRSRSTDKTYRALPLGHIDLLVGRDAPLMTWSLVERWIDRRVHRRVAIAA